MGEKKRYRSQRGDAKRKPTLPRPRNLDKKWNHVSELPGYLPEKINITFRLLKDNDVQSEVIDGLRQEFNLNP
jgi:hypothetical protein